MRTRWMLVGFLMLLVVELTAIVTYGPRPAQAQGIGFALSGQQAVTASAVVVSGTSYGTICIKALQGNTINVYVGGSGVTTANGMELTPGNAYCSPVANGNQFYVVASTTGASISWLVSR